MVPRNLNTRRLRLDSALAKNPKIQNSKIAKLPIFPGFRISGIRAMPQKIWKKNPGGVWYFFFILCAKTAPILVAAMPGRGPKLGEN